MVDKKLAALATTVDAVAVAGKPAVGLEAKYQSQLQEVAEKFDPSKYTYISYEYETE